MSRPEISPHILMETGDGKMQREGESDKAICGEFQEACCIRN